MIPVVLSERFGLPVRQVESGAPVMVVAENGYGIPIILSDRGCPFIVQGAIDPDDFWQSFTLTAGDASTGDDEWQSFELTAGES